MSSDKKPENPSSNIIVFGPLIRHAIIAVILVSIIVITAIMLNSQLYTAEEQISMIEKEIAAYNASDTDRIESSSTVAVALTKPALINAEIIRATEIKLPAINHISPEVSLIANSPATTPLLKTVAVINNTTPPVSKMVAKTTKKSQHSANSQFRLSVYKLKQKHSLTDFFARIKLHEKQRLDQYKSRQNSQVERLRERITRQQQRVESLVVRNNEVYNLRVANTQQNQEKREQILNRI